MKNPVFLASSNNVKTVDLTWTIDGETNEKFYLLERSSDGINYSIIGQVNVKAKNIANNFYKFIDNNPIVGIINYYRLSSVDDNGENKNNLKTTFSAW